jgi:hypothetical protein
MSNYFNNTFFPVLYMYSIHTLICHYFVSEQNTYASFLNFNHDKIKSLDFKPGMCSFNVGVYVFNADLWREKNLTKQLEYWTELNTRLAQYKVYFSIYYILILSQNECFMDTLHWFSQTYIHI